MRSRRNKKTPTNKCEKKRFEGNSVTKCVSNVLEKPYGKKLGAGEQGTVYEIDNQVVIKVTSLEKVSEDVWFNEVCIAEALGLLDIAPKIHNHFICYNHGYIIMDRLIPMKSAKVSNNKEAISSIKQNTSDVVRYKWVIDGTNEFMDNLSVLSHSTQEKMIEILEIMIDNGYIHMDNHIDNIGYNFMTKEPIVYDFGFTQFRPLMVGDNVAKKWALCFSLFQILEHCPLNQIQNTKFYHVATACINNTYIWGNKKSGTMITIPKLKKMMDDKGETLVEFVKNTNDKSINSYRDVFIGCFCYAKVITVEKEKRNEKFLDFIYLTRDPNNKNINDKNVKKIYATTK